MDGHNLSGDIFHWSDSSVRHAKEFFRTPTYMVIVWWLQCSDCIRIKSASNDEPQKWMVDSGWFMWPKIMNHFHPFSSIFWVRQGFFTPTSGGIPSHWGPLCSSESSFSQDRRDLAATDEGRMTHEISHVVADRMEITNHLLNSNWILGKRFDCISGILWLVVWRNEQTFWPYSMDWYCFKNWRFGSPFPLLRTCCGSMSITKSCLAIATCR